MHRRATAFALQASLPRPSNGSPAWWQCGRMHCADGLVTRGGGCRPEVETTAQFHKAVTCLSRVSQDETGPRILRKDMGGPASKVWALGIKSESQRSKALAA